MAGDDTSWKEAALLEIDQLLLWEFGSGLLRQRAYDGARMLLMELDDAPSVPALAETYANFARKRLGLEGELVPASGQQFEGPGHTLRRIARGFAVAAEGKWQEYQFRRGQESSQIGSLRVDQEYEPVREGSDILVKNGEGYSIRTFANRTSPQGTRMLEYMRCNGLIVKRSELSRILASSEEGGMRLMKNLSQQIEQHSLTDLLTIVKEPDPGPVVRYELRPR